MKKERILVTGGSGNLGRTLIPKLVSDGFDCISISRKSDRVGSVNNIKCDITNFQKVNSVINQFKPNIIIHLAGLTGNLECEANPKQAFSSNVFGTLNILEASVKLRPKIIFSSTREVYGFTKIAADENYPLKPVNNNGITKMVSEYLIKNFHSMYSTPYVILRFPNCYGENYTKRGLSSLFKKAIRNEKIKIFGGNQILDLLHFNDAADAIIKSIFYNKTGIFNIGSGKAQRLVSIINKLKIILNKDIDCDFLPIRSFEVGSCKLNINRAEKNLKFKASIKLDDILRKMISN
jgi:nucleoside-diphosphate-sugar epimerase